MDLLEDGGGSVSKSSTFTFRLSPETKREAAKLYADFGLTLSDAINLFLHQSLIEGGLPFEVKRAATKETVEKQ